MILNRVDYAFLVLCVVACFYAFTAESDFELICISIGVVVAAICVMAHDVDWTRGRGRR